MNTKERLEKLKLLSDFSELEYGFKSQKDRIKWVNEVGKLISYDPVFYNQFTPQSNIINSRWIAKKLGATALNKIVTVAHMAIADLESNQTKENETKENETKENETKENETKENETKSFSPVQEVRRVWHESFSGKLLLIVITIVLTFVFSTFVFPKLTAEKQQPSKESSIPNLQQKTVEIVPIKGK